MMKECTNSFKPGLGWPVEGLEVIGLAAPLGWKWVELLELRHGFFTEILST